MPQKTTCRLHNFHACFTNNKSMSHDCGCAPQQRQLWFVSKETMCLNNTFFVSICTPQIQFVPPYYRRSPMIIKIEYPSKCTLSPYQQPPMPLCVTIKILWKGVAHSANNKRISSLSVPQCVQATTANSNTWSLFALFHPQRPVRPRRASVGTLSVPMSRSLGTRKRNIKYIITIVDEIVRFAL